MTYSASHTYLDDSPTGTTADTYTVTVTVTDDDTGVRFGLDVGRRQQRRPVKRDRLRLSGNDQRKRHDHGDGTFADPGTLDVHTVTINWGDGSSHTVLNLAVGARTYSASHQYLDDNPTGTASDPTRSASS